MNSSDGDSEAGPNTERVVVVLYSTTIFVALTGNLLLIFIVTRRPETRTITSFLFVNMAAADLLVTLIVMPMNIVSPYTEMKWHSGTAGDVMCKFAYFAYHVSIAASILSLTFMAVDRYLAVCYPLRRFTTFRRAGVLTFVIWLSSMILMIPAAVLWKIEEGNIPVKGWFCVPAFAAVFGDYEKGMTGYYTYLFIIAYLVPLLVISLLYGMVCRALWRRKIPGVILSENEGRHAAMKRKVVRTLLIVTAAFAICWIPTQAFHLILAYNLRLYNRFWFYICVWFGNANSAFNPWLYMLLTDKFRSALQEILLIKYSGDRARSFRAQFSTRYITVRESISLRRHPQSQREKKDEPLKHRETRL